MSTHADDIDDMVIGALKDLGRNEIVQIAQGQQGYEAYSYLFAKKKLQFGDGYGINKNIMDRLSGTASYHGMFQKITPKIVNLLRSMTVPWRHASAHWAYEIREMMMNKGKSRVVDIIKPRRASAVINLIEVIEEKFFGAAPIVADTDSPWGLQYWIVKNATEGFNGGYPQDHTTMAGISLTTTTTFQNYTGTYTDVSKPDLITKWRKALWSMDWQSPISIQDFRTFGRTYRFWMPYDVLAECETIGENQNENLGRDLAPMDGVMTFHRHALVAVPYLQNNTTDDPIYGVNLDTFAPVCLTGDYFREGQPYMITDMPNGRWVNMDLTHNYICMDRRRNMVFYRA